MSDHRVLIEENPNHDPEYLAEQKALGEKELKAQGQRVIESAEKAVKQAEHDLAEAKKALARAIKENG